MSDAYWKIAFVFAAIFNFVVGLPLLLAPLQALAVFGLPQPPTFLFEQFTGGMVVIFGACYAAAARDLARREMVWLGIAGKLFAVLLLLSYRLADQISDTMFSLGMGDLAFVAVFLWFLFGGRKRQRALAE